MVVGLTAEQETEAVDKTTLALPGAKMILCVRSRPPPGEPWW